MIRTHAYAERLQEDLDKVDWLEPIKKMQRTWIGRSEGAEIDFSLAPSTSAGKLHEAIRVFTTRPDTLFGATYMVLAPEHPLVAAVTTKEQRAAVEAYTKEAAGKSDLERTELAKKKTGAFTGAYAINPDVAWGRRNGQAGRVHGAISARRIAAVATGAGRLQALGPAGATVGEGDRLGVGDPPRQALQARDQHHAAVGRLLLVLSALPGPAQRQNLLRAGQGAVLDAGRSA